MATQDNTAIVHRLLDIWNGGDPAAVDSICAEDFVDHNGLPGQVDGPDGMRQSIAAYRGAFPDLHMKIEDLIGQGDRVVVRWTSTGTHRGELLGIPPTGRRTSSAGINIYRLEGGKIAEGWSQFDQMGLMQQLGVLPTA